MMLIEILVGTGLVCVISAAGYAGYKIGKYVNRK